MAERLPSVAGCMAILLMLAAAQSEFVQSAEAREPPARKPSPPLLVERIAPDHVQFASEALRMRYDAIRQRIGEMVDAGWKTEPLTLTQLKWDRDQYLCTASWQRDIPPEPGWQPLRSPHPRPKHSINLTMRPTAGDPHVMQSLELNISRVSPYNGWSAQIRLLHTSAGEDLLILWFNHNQRYVHDLPASGRGFFMPHRSVGARDRPKGSNIELLVQSDVPWEPYQRQLVTAVATPRALRDLELKLCDELEAALKEAIAASRLSMIDWTHVRSDNPPRQMPIGPGGGEPVAAETQQRLIDEGVLQLNRRRERWNTEAAELHEAVRQAFPPLVEWAIHRQGVSPRTTSRR